MGVPTDFPMVWYYSMAFSDEGGTSAIYIFMVQLALFNEGVLSHFTI